MNVQIVNDSPERLILERLGGSESLSQRQIAREVGISVGLTNLLLKRMARKGWIKVRNLSPRKLAYVVTPRGIREKGELLYRQFEQTLQFYQQAKQRVVDQVARLRSRGVRRVVLYGTDNVAEIVYLAVQEAGLELVAVCDDARPGERWLSHPVRRLSDLPRDAYEVVVLSYLKDDRVEEFRKAHPAVPYALLRDG